LNVVAMKTAVVMDSACDLPAAYIQRHQLYLLPNRVVLGDQILTDNRDVNLTLAFHHRYAQSRNLEAATTPCSAGAIADLFLDRLVIDHDRAMVMTISQTRSPLFQNATEASFAIVRGYRERRQGAGLNTPFQLNVLDSQTVFAGQAVLAHEVIRLLQNPELPFGELRRVAEAFRRYIRCYVLLDDLSPIRRQASEKDANGIGFLNYHLGSLLGLKPVARFVEGKTELALKARGFERALAGLFDLAKLEIDQGLRSPLVVLSYAGDLRVFMQNRAFIDFERHIRQWGVEVMVSIMSATGGVYLGPNAVSLAFAVV
jgi:DegV family protein with EDD domain